MLSTPSRSINFLGQGSWCRIKVNTGFSHSLPHKPIRQSSTSSQRIYCRCHQWWGSRWWWWEYGKVGWLFCCCHRWSLSSAASFVDSWWKRRSIYSLNKRCSGNPHQWNNSPTMCHCWARFWLRDRISLTDSQISKFSKKFYFIPVCSTMLFPNPHNSLGISVTALWPLWKYRWTCRRNKSQLFHFLIECIF